MLQRAKFAFSCIVLVGYAGYAAYALYYFLSFQTPLGTALLALVGAVLALTAAITFISYRVNLRGKPRPRWQRLLRIAKLTLQLAATALTVVFFVSAAHQQAALPWIVAGISAAITSMCLAVNIAAEVLARKYPQGLGKKRFVRGTLPDADGKQADIAQIVANIGTERAALCPLRRRAAYPTRPAPAAGEKTKTGAAQRAEAFENEKTKAGAAQNAENPAAGEAQNAERETARADRAAL